MSNPDQSPANSPLQARAIELHTKAFMPMSQAEELALSELGLDDAAIDELSAEACCTVLLTLLDAEDVRAFTRAILVHQSAVTSTQAAAPTEAAAMAATVPAGWKPAPHQATAHMVEEGCRAWRANAGMPLSTQIAVAYGRMLIVAPQAPVADQPAEPSPAARISVDRDPQTGAYLLGQRDLQAEDAARYRFLCEHPDWKFIETLCLQFSADNAEEFRRGMNRVIDAHRAAGTSNWGMVTEPSLAPEGFEHYYIKGLDPLFDALNRAVEKGYMPDAIYDAWVGFDYRPAAPKGDSNG